MRSTTPADLAGRCPQCFLLTRLCLCAAVPRVDSRVELLLVRHHKERFKSTNTARLVTLAMPRARMVAYGTPGAPFDASVLAAPGTWLLFPGGADARSVPPGAVRRLVVLDGSWGQARRMVQRVPALNALPHFSLPPPRPGTQRLRTPPHPEGMSTLEAVAEAVGLLEGEAAAEALRALHALMVERTLAARGRVGPDGLVHAPAAPDEA